MSALDAVAVNVMVLNEWLVSLLVSTLRPATKEVFPGG